MNFHQGGTPMSWNKPDLRIARDVVITSGTARLEGELIIPSRANGIVLFAHGSGSSRLSPRNKFVARTLHEADIATLLFDLLTQEEEEEERYTAHLRFDIGLLARRLRDATQWVAEQENTRHFGIGYFGSSTGAAAALVAAAGVGNHIQAIVSRGGRPDLAGESLPFVKAPTLLIVGERDMPVIKFNRDAYNQLACEKRVEIVPRATHLFEEPGTLEKVAQLATQWFQQHFKQVHQTAAQVGE
jgi:dienelactone hydrolase